MLTDALIERYSRQILLPEVGGRGQERLCGTTVTVAGAGAAADFARALLAATGVRVCATSGAPGTVTAGLGDTTVVVGRFRRDGGAVVATLCGRPCARCVPAEALGDSPVDDRDEDPARAQVLGAAVAAETLVAALGLLSRGRLQTFDLVRGRFAGRPLAATEGCSACTTAA